MRRHALVLFLIATAWMLGDHPISAQQTPADPCPLNLRRGIPEVERAREAKKRRLRENGVPERYLHLLDNFECLECINRAPDTVHVTVVWKEEFAPRLSTGALDTVTTVRMLPQVERQLRDDLATGRVESFHVWISEKRCRCCPDDEDKKPEDYDDWDDDLGVNTDQADSFDDPSDLPPLPDDLKRAPAGWMQPPPIEEFSKPRRRHMQVTCDACQGLADQWNTAAGGLDYLWDRKLSLQRQMNITANAIGNRNNQINELEYQQQFDTTRNYDRMKQIEAMRDVNEAQRSDIDREERELADVEKLIAEQQARMDALMQKVLECEKACRKTTKANAPTSPPVAAPPPATPNETTGTVGVTLSDAPAAPSAACGNCERLEAEARALGQQHFKTFEAGASLRQESDALWEQIRVDSEAFQIAIRSGQTAEVGGLRARMNAAVQRRGELEAEIGRNRNLSNDLMLQLLRKGAELRDCNNTCTTTTPAANDVPAVSPPTTPVSCVGEACAEEWKACSATNSCRPIDEDCGVPGTCTAGAGDVPVVNIADPAPWNYAGPATGITIKLVQVKMAEFPDTPSVERSANAGAAGPGLIVPPAAVADVREWFNPLGLLASHIRGQVDRWRGSAGPRPLLTRRDLKLLDTYAGGQAAGLPKGVHVLLTDRGGSTGKTLGMQILNLTGKPVRLAAMPFAIEPIEQKAAPTVQNAFGRLSKALPMKIDLNAYCAEMLKAPPSANTLYRLAPKEIQEKFAPMSKVLRSAYRVNSAGLLNPDSNPGAYADAIKQWAVWAVEQKFNEARFTDAFVGHTRKNVEAAGQQWSRPVEDTLRKASPNRWRDVAKVLRGAGVAVPQ